MFLCTLNLCLLNGIFRPLTFSVITAIIELISTIFVTVFFLLPLIIVPVFTFHNFSDFCGFIGACYDSIFSSFSAYDLCSFSCFISFFDFSIGCFRVCNIHYKYNGSLIKVGIRSADLLLSHHGLKSAVVPPYPWIHNYRFI